MPEQHGGPRTPAHPAPVSGPGSLSRRTDGGPTTQPPMVASGGPYGSRKDMEAIQSGADMQGGGGSSPAPADLIPFGAPTQNPDEPVTAGAPVGPGLGPQAAGILDDNTLSLEKLAPLVNSLELMANLPTSTPESRAFVRSLKSRLAAMPPAAGV